jgi:hypothetical protein
VGVPGVPPGVPPPNDGVPGVAWSGCAVIVVEWILDEKKVQLFLGGSAGGSAPQRRMRRKN